MKLEELKSLKNGSVIWCIWNEGYWSFCDERVVQSIDEKHISFGKYDTYKLDEFRIRNYAIKSI